MVRLIFKRLLLVQLVVSSIAVLGNTIDSLIVARMLGTNAIAACGLLNPFAILTAAISAVISSGTQIVCSRSVGAGKPAHASRQLGIAFAASTAFSAVIVALGYLFMDQFCLLLGASPDTQLFLDTKAYAYGLLASCIPSTPIALTMFTCVSNGDMKRCRISGVSIVCLNIAFSLASILIFNGGLFGVGLATTISTYLSFFYLLGHFRNKKASLKPTFSGLSWKDFKQIIFVGSPRAAHKVCTFLLIFLFNNLLLDFYSHEYVAAYSVVRNIYGITSFTTSALLYCTSLVTSMFFGEEDRRALHDTVREFVRLGLIMGITGFVIMLVFGRLIALLFLDPGTNIYEIACRGLAIISAALPLCALAASLHAYFIGTGHQGWGTALNIISVLVLTPIAGFAFMPLLGPLFVYAAIPTGYLLDILVIGGFVALKKRRNPLRTSSYLFVPEGFGVQSEQELCLEVRNPDDLARSKAQFERFCQSVGCGEVGDQSFQVVSLFANSCLKRKEGRRGEACFVRVFRKGEELNVVIWSTFGLAKQNPLSHILGRDKTLPRGAKLSSKVPTSTGGEDRKATPTAQRDTGNNATCMDAKLSEFLEGCGYSLSHPFGLDRLRVVFERSEDLSTRGALSR